MNHQQAFTNASCYREWRAHWRRQLAETVEGIRMAKAMCRVYGGGWRGRAAQSNLRAFQMQARSLMIAREAVEAFYRERRAADPKKHNQQAADRVELAFPSDAAA